MDVALDPITAQTVEDDDITTIETADVNRVGWLTLEIALYVLLALLSLTLRLVHLDRAPLDDAESYEALAALRAVDDQTPGPELVAHSPITFTLQASLFSLGFADNFAARLPIALGGVLLTLSPVLWRRYLHPMPPLIISLLLTISPVSLLASRAIHPAIWSALLIVILPWFVLRYIETGRMPYATAATLALAALIFLSEPAGFVLLLTLVLGIAFAAMLEPDPDSLPRRSIRILWREWPWRSAIWAAGGLVVILGTGLFILPPSLTVVGNLLWEGLRGFVVRQTDAPIAFPLLLELRYEPGLLIFGLIGTYSAIRDGGFFERTVAGWFLASVIASLAYAGAGSAHTLWLTLPLAILIGLMVTRWITEQSGVLWQKAPAWGIGGHAALTAGMWFWIGLTLVLIGKAFLTEIPAGVTDLNDLTEALVQGRYSSDINKTEWITVGTTPVMSHILGYLQLRTLTVGLITLLMGVMYFLFGSIWGARSAWRGFALGTLTYFTIIGLGWGGRAAFVNTGDPREFWYLQPVSADITEMRATLDEMSLRDNGETKLIHITALVPTDGALAWALRDYPNTTFVNGIGRETKSGIVIAPPMLPEPDLGASYIGKDLLIRSSWEVSQISWRDILMWLYRSDSYMQPAPYQQVMFWVRNDIYGVEQVPD